MRALLHHKWAQSGVRLGARVSRAALISHRGYQLSVFWAGKEP